MDQIEDHYILKFPKYKKGDCEEGCKASCMWIILILMASAASAFFGYMIGMDNVYNICSNNSF